MTTADVISYLLERDRQAIELHHLCGSMIATLQISRNRDRMREGDGEAIESLIALSDRWAKEFDRISGEQATLQTNFKRAVDEGPAAATSRRVNEAQRIVDLHQASTRRE